ncbi:ligase-associated DNA damage response endonuclease PdeM [Psychroserpens sp. XS_ASV72]|uniref:ligase-associated DNA damage response endonuclease PdeM n=1 Tax=Psychroserpens sp. XS_ASV72 TaxID=3241293 RepID=UPI003513DDAA
MIYAEQSLKLKGEELILNNLRALFWQREQALIVSDMHIGKTAHFRKHGIPVSADVQDNDLKRLSFLLKLYKVKQLIVVGDLFHAERNSDVEKFQDWRKSHENITIVLVKGNHDKFRNELFQQLDIKVIKDHLNIHPFKFIHEPEEKDGFSISGHIHPGYVVKNKNLPRVKLPCFQVSNHNLILPAFSMFTGLNTSKGENDVSYYAFTETAFYKFI